MVRIFCFLVLLFNVAYGQELKTITPEQFIAENPSPERKIIIDHLIHQFDSKREAGVTQDQLDKLWANQEVRDAYMMARFQIIDQKVYAQSYYLAHYYFPTLLQYFQTLAQKYKINDVDFIIYMREEIPMKNDLGKQTMGVPAFIMFQDQNSIYEMDKLIFPDAFFIKENWSSRWRDLTARIEKASLDNPWDNKINKIFWRGVTTGDFFDYTLENFEKLPRLAISILSKLYPDSIDAKFSSYTLQMTDKNLKKLCELLFGQTPANVSMEDHLKYKYLLSLDGNAATGTRVPWIMLSNSVLVKQDSQKIQWFYSALKPYVHYVPLEHRLLDVFQQIDWMKAHDQEVKQISLNGNNFVKNNLMPDHIDQHIVLLLNEYSSIQKDIKIIPTLTKAEDVVSIPSVLDMYLYKIKRYLVARINTWF